jgi:hypothetical protein
MASISSVSHDRPTLELNAEVIIGARRSQRRLTLDCTPEFSADVVTGDERLLVAINPTVHLALLRYPAVERFSLGEDVFWLQLPSWMQPPTSPESWRSQSVSGALYPSRTDLREAYGVPGVVLLQLLKSRWGAPCFTSCHRHLGTREVFEPLDEAGHTHWRQASGRWRRLTRRLDIEPGVQHQLRRVEPGFSVVLIQMYGITSIEHGPSGPQLDMSDHIYG